MFSISELHQEFESLTRNLASSRINVTEYIYGLNLLAERADQANLPFIFSPEDIQERFVKPATSVTLAANDDNEPFLVGIDYIENEPSEDEEESSSSDFMSGFVDSDESDEDPDPVEPTEDIESSEYED